MFLGEPPPQQSRKTQDDLSIIHYQDVTITSYCEINLGLYVLNHIYILLYPSTVQRIQMTDLLELLLC